jgi:hypothetical protein
VSAKIYAELDREFIHSMRQWAWNEAGRKGPAISSAYSGEFGSGYFGPRVPRIRMQRGDINHALLHVPTRYRQAVRLFWQWEGAPLTYIAERSGTGVDYRTIQARIIRGHELLRAAINRLAAEIEAQKEVQS